MSRLFLRAPSPQSRRLCPLMEKSFPQRPGRLHYSQEPLQSFRKHAVWRGNGDFYQTLSRGWGVIYFCFVQGDVASAAQLLARGRPKIWAQPHCCLSRSEQAGVGSRGQEIALVKDQESPSHPPITLQQTPVPLRGRVPFYTDPWEVPPENRLCSPSLSFLRVQSFSPSQQHVDPNIPL